MMRHRHRLARGAVIFAQFALISASVQAGVSVTLDRATLNTLLSEVSASRVEVPLTGTRSLTVLLEELKVVGLRPAGAGSAGPPEDRIETSLYLRVPSLGLRVPVRPQLSTHVAEVDGVSLLELRFHEVELDLPFTSIDIASLLAPIRFPAESVFLLAGAEGDVPILSRLTRVRMEQDALHLELSVEVVKD